MTMTLHEFIMQQVRTMTLDDCIKYMENVSSERKPRSRKARHILRYLRDLKGRIEAVDRAIPFGECVDDGREAGHMPKMWRKN